MIYLRNSGVLDLQCLSLMGVNVKTSDSPIGQFGTGLKYAIAVFLREGVEVKLYLGENLYTFDTEELEIRGKTFETVHMHGPFDTLVLPFTTELGSGWELWQAYREIHSNCLDENGSISEEDSLPPAEGFTTFVIDMDVDIDSIFLSKDNYVGLFSDKDIEIYKGSSSVIYYQGIKAKELSEEALYTYNIKKKCTLTEDRLLCYDHEISELISQKIITMEDKVHTPIVKDVVTAESGSYEHNIGPAYYSYDKPSEVFKETVTSTPQTTHRFKEYHVKHLPTPELTPEEKVDTLLDEIDTLVCDAGFTWEYEPSEEGFISCNIDTNIEGEDFDDDTPF